MVLTLLLEAGQEGEYRMLNYMYYFAVFRPAARFICILQNLIFIKAKQNPPVPHLLIRHHHRQFMILD